jgi:hypothetical protein
MGDTVVFTLTLDRTGIPPTWARLWVQVDPADPDKEAEVHLSTSDAKVWAATYTYPGTSRGTLFLLRFQAPRTTQWAFKAERGTDKPYNVEKQTTAVVITQATGALS